jgi:hypothetical protein
MSNPLIDESELIKGAKIQSELLTGADEEAYVRALSGAIRAARLNLYYPEARALRAHVEALAPRTHRGLYGGVERNIKSGLPTYKEFTRVQTDVRIAGDQLRQLGGREALAAKAAGSAAEIHARQLAKHDYYTDLLDRPLAPLGEMSVALRRVDPESRTAWFHVVLDKLDASGLFVRYAIDLSQRSSAWSKDVVTLDDETAQHTEEFQSLIYKFTALDAEFTFIKLAAFGHLEVERVAKGTVGPFYFGPEQAPAPLKPMLSAPGAFVAMFALDMVADDVAEDKDNDPLDDLLADKLSQQAQKGYAAAREQYAYKCFKDRKFVAPRAVVPALRAFCAEAGTKNIIYGV